MFGQDARYKKINGGLSNTQAIRNVSIVAHVDHGKTTLADCLIASNGLIHRKQAGQLRLLDDRLDEQDRGITMKSSSIALLHQDHVINIIDSPGHLQFYSEVTAALRLTDAALLVVDAVEGVSSQTYRVLHQLYSQKLPSILVLNKIDKLINHCKMDPLQAFQHLSQLIEQVNAILGSFIAKEVGYLEKEEQQKGDEEQPFEKLETHFYFSIEKKNVVFASSVDNWGFEVDSFSSLIAKKLGKKQEQIQKYLWGEYYFNPRTKTFSTEPRNENDKPICVDWLLKPIWDIFEHVQNQNFDKIDKMTTALGLKISPFAKKAKGHALIKEILSQWLPLDRLVLNRIVSELPNPIQAQNFRLPYLLELNTRNQKPSPHIMKALADCNRTQEAPFIAFVSKMITVQKKQINERGLEYGAEQDSAVIGFARIFSGRIRRGQKVFVIGVKPKKVETATGQIIEVPDIEEVTVSGLYFFNGQYPEGIEEGFAGCIVGIAGLEAHIFKSGTISSSKDCLSFVPVSSQTKTILKVSVSTEDIKDGPKLLAGLKKLNRSDPSVDVYAEGNGDLILNTCGQVHLEKCIVDLETIYCKVPVKTSEPIIAFRETITWLTLKQIKNQKYLKEIEKKRQHELKKKQKEEYKIAMLADAELDDVQKEKNRAVREWDSHVEIYESEDLTVTDTRYFLTNRNDINQYKKDFVFREEVDLKKLDHKNRGRFHKKEKCLNLNMKTNLCVMLTPNNRFKITIRALGLPFVFAEYLEKQAEKMGKLFEIKAGQIPEGDNQKKARELILQQRSEFVKETVKILEEEGIEAEVLQLILTKMVCFGPNATSGTNILVSHYIKPGQSFLERATQDELGNEDSDWLLDESVRQMLEELQTGNKEIVTAIKHGFWQACLSGPLANEQMMGVLFIVEKIEAVQPPKEEKQEEDKKEDKKEGNKEENQEDKKEDKKEDQKEDKKEDKKEDNAQDKKEENKEYKKEEKQVNKQEMAAEPSKKQNKEQHLVIDNYGTLSNQLMPAVKDCCLEAFLGGGPRVVEPMYICELHTDQTYYGSIHGQLSKRRAQIISEDLHQFSNFLIIKAYLPMVESNNFCFDILDTTQGTVNAQLTLDTWKIIEEDPFFTPLTIEEIQENGLDKNQYNQSRIILDKIRHKKGIHGTQKIVVAAQKQRTLKKK